MTLDEVKGKLKSLTQGQKSENVVNWMANTFKSLSELADWSGPAVVLISYRRNSQRLQSFQLPRLRLLSGL